MSVFAPGVRNGEEGATLPPQKIGACSWLPLTGVVIGGRRAIAYSGPKTIEIKYTYLEQTTTVQGRRQREFTVISLFPHDHASIARPCSLSYTIIASTSARILGTLTS